MMARTCIRWQAVGNGHVAGQDAPGLNEAVGTLLEIAAGLDAAARRARYGAGLRRPVRDCPNRPRRPLPGSFLPDRAVTIRAEGDRIVVGSLDGSLTTLDAGGKIVSQQGGGMPVVGKPAIADPKKLRPSRAFLQIASRS